MADVLGILGFALHAAHKVYTIIESIKDAPNEIQALRDDAFQVYGFLEKVLSSLDEGGRSNHLRAEIVEDPQIDALLKKAQAMTSVVNAFIKKTTTQKDDGTYAVKKLTWPLYAADAKKLSEEFKAFYVSLTAAYTVSTSYAFFYELFPGRPLIQLIASRSRMCRRICEPSKQRSRISWPQFTQCLLRFVGRLASNGKGGACGSTKSARHEPVHIQSPFLTQSHMQRHPRHRWTPK